MNGYLSIFQGILSTENNYLDIYLDGLEDHQGFYIKSGDTDEIVQNISSLLTKSVTRPLGLRLLTKFLDQCSIAVFERKANLWTTLVLKACNIQELQSVAHLTFDVLGKLAAKSQQVPDLSKTFASTHLSKIYESLGNVPQSSVKYCLRCIEKCLRLYPSSSGPSRGIIEKFLCKFYDSLDEEVVVSCGKCLQLLQQVRGGGVQGVNHKTLWKNYQIQLLGSIHVVYNEIFAKCAEIYDDNAFQGQLPFTTEQLALDDEPVKRSAQLYARCHNLIQHLIIALKEPFPVEKPILVKKILNIINRGLGVTCTTLEQNPIADNFAIGILLPKLHLDLLELLSTMIAIMRGYIRPYSQLILGLLIDTLKWTSSKNMNGNRKPLLKLRAKAYETIGMWCKILQSGSRCDSIAEYLCHEIINDVTPAQSEFTLKVLSGARKHMSKKARRQLHKAQNDQSNLSQAHSNDNSIRKESNSDVRNQLLCVSALRCLQDVLLSVANFMKPTTIKLLHTNIIQISAILCELSIKPTHLYHNYQCRMEIYNCLYVMLMTPHHLCPPPTEVILSIFQTVHNRDGSSKVRCHCGSLLQNLEKIIHPQKESLLFLVEARDIRNTFIKMGQERLLHSDAINFSNEKISNEINGSISEQEEEDELENEITDANAIVTKESSMQSENDNVYTNKLTANNIITEHNAFNKQMHEEKYDLTETKFENPSKSPEFVLRIDDDGEIAETDEENTNYDVDLNEPAIKKPRRQNSSNEVCPVVKSVSENNDIIEMDKPSSAFSGSERDVTNEVDDEKLLEDIASQFVDELN